MRFILLSLILVFNDCCNLYAQDQAKRIDAIIVDPDSKTDAIPLSFIEFSETGVVTSSKLPDKDLEVLLRHNAIPAKIAQYLLIPDFPTFSLFVTTNISITPDDLEKWLFNTCKEVQGCEYKLEKNSNVFYEFTLSYEEVEEEIYDKFIDPINKKAVRVKEKYTIHSDGNEIVGFIKVVARDWSETIPIQMLFQRIDQSIHIQYAEHKVPSKKYILEEKSGQISSLRLEYDQEEGDSGEDKTMVFEYNPNDKNPSYLTKVIVMDKEGDIEHFLLFKYSFWEN